MTLDPLHHLQHAALQRVVTYADLLPKSLAMEIRVAIAMYEERVQTQPPQPDCKACEGA